MASQPSSGDTYIYQLTLQWDDASVQCTVNDFPMAGEKASGAESQPVNLILAGKENRLAIRVKPKSKDAIVSGDLKKVSKADGSVSLVWSIDLSKMEKDHEEIFVFDSGPIDFSDVIVKTKIVTREDVNDYAGQLYNLWKNNDTEKLLDAMDVKVRDYAKTVGAPEAALRAQLAGLFVKQNLPEKGDFELLPIGDGRIWEIRVKPEKSFFFFRSDDGYQRIPVYVASVGNKLQIIR